jgi:hypothetical protein
MKRCAFIAILVLLIPFWFDTATASTRADSTNATAARFAAGLSLEKSGPVGTLALITRISPHFFNASSLLSSGQEGGLSSQVFWTIYQTPAVSVALGIGASVDVIDENPTYDQAVTYLSSTPGLALTLKPGANIMIHLAYVNLNPGENPRGYRFHALLSLPLSP